MMNADGFAGFSRRQQRMGTRGISPVPGACQSRYVKLEIQALCQSWPRTYRLNLFHHLRVRNQRKERGPTHDIAEQDRGDELSDDLPPGPFAR
jgi:hypothetical protein